MEVTNLETIEQPHVATPIHDPYAWLQEVASDSGEAAARMANYHQICIDQLERQLQQLTMREQFMHSEFVTALADYDGLLVRSLADAAGEQSFNAKHLALHQLLQLIVYIASERGTLSALIQKAREDLERGRADLAYAKTVAATMETMRSFHPTNEGI